MSLSSRPALRRSKIMTIPPWVFLSVLHDATATPANAVVVDALNEARPDLARMIDLVGPARTPPQHRQVRSAAAVPVVDFAEVAPRARNGHFAATATLQLSARAVPTATDAEISRVTALELAISYLLPACGQRSVTRCPPLQPNAPSALQG